MAAISGHTGSVTFATGYTTDVKEWSIDYAGEALESTNFDSSGNREYVAGLKGWSGSYSCNLDDTTVVTEPAASAAEATFTASSGRTFAGDIIVTSVSVGASVDSLNEVSIDFQGTGALTIS